MTPELINDINCLGVPGLQSLEQRLDDTAEREREGERVREGGKESHSRLIFTHCCLLVCVLESCHVSLRVVAGICKVAVRNRERQVDIVKEILKGLEWERL